MVGRHPQFDLLQCCAFVASGGSVGIFCVVVVVMVVVMAMMMVAVMEVTLVVVMEGVVVVVVAISQVQVH